jgi:hypothetical protein
VPAQADRWIAWPEFWLRNEANFRRARTAIVEFHAVAQYFQRRCVRHTFDLYPVGFWQLVFWFSNTCLKFPVVSKQQQALAIVVESPGRSHQRHGRSCAPCARDTYPSLGDRNKFCECAATVLIGELAQDIERLVEQDEHYSSSVSSCAYAGAQQQSRCNASMPVFSMQCGVPGGMQIVSPGPT